MGAAYGALRSGLARIDVAAVQRPLKPVMRLSLLLPACLCLAASPSMAADDLAALDLSLPQASASPYRNDPPGTYYGDASGVPAAPADAAARFRRACPTTPDGEPTDLTGQVAMGVGHSRLGTSRYGAVGLNYCKSTIDDEGDERTFNMQLHMDKTEGPMPMIRTGPGSGPWRRGL